MCNQSPAREQIVTKPAKRRNGRQKRRAAHEDSGQRKLSPERLYLDQFDAKLKLVALLYSLTRLSQYGGVLDINGLRSTRFTDLRESTSTAQPVLKPKPDAAPSFLLF